MWMPMESLYQTHRDAKIAIVVQCGVWSAWQNGLHQGKINTRKKFGYSRNVHVPCVGHRFVYWMCVTWKGKIYDEHNKLLVIDESSMQKVPFY